MSFGLALVAVVAFGLAGCGSDGNGNGSGPYDLTFNGSGFGPHDGQTLYLVVVDEATDQVVQSDSAVVSGCSFDFSYPDLLADGGTYRIDYYADVNANDECEPNDDHYWSANIAAVSGDVVVQESHRLDFDLAACESFPGDGEPKSDLTISGTGFGPHDGKTLYVSVIRLDNDNEVEASSAVVAGGAFSFNWVDAIEQGKSYRVDYFADVDSDGFCTAGADHVWRASIGVVGGDVVLDLTHSLDFTDAACESFSMARAFDLTFTGVGFGPHDGQTLFAAVIEVGSGTEVGSDSADVSGGAFSFSWPGLLMEGKDYRIDYYADVNDDAQWAQGNDHVWSVAIASVGDAVLVEETHSLNFDFQACDSF